MISITVQGADRLLIFLDAMASDATVFGLVTILGEMSRGQVVEHFGKETGPLGRWDPLRPSTIARRKKNSSAVLQDDGILMGSIDFITGGATAQVGTNVFYGKYHQYGGTWRGRPNPPQRAFLGWTPGDLDELQVAAVAYLGRMAA